MFKVIKCIFRLAVFTAICASLVTCTTVGPGAGNVQSRILAIGDSMMDWNAKSGASIPHAIARSMGQPVTSRAVAGAHVIYSLPITGSAGLRISSQYISGGWDWVVMNGGGNDLWLGCGCSDCRGRLSKMITDDGRRGEIPATVARIRQSGAKVLYLGYLRSPGRGSPIDDCRDEGDVLEARLTKMARQMPDVFFLSLADVVPYGSRSFHADDMVHPSPIGSKAIGVRAARLMLANEAP